MYTEIRFSGLYSSSLRMKSIPYDDSLFISVHCLKGKEIVPLACSDKTYLHTFQSQDNLEVILILANLVHQDNPKDRRF